MTVKLLATATATDKHLNITKDKEYSVFKITYEKLFSEGRITIINDNNELVRVSSYYFTFKEG